MIQFDFPTWVAIAREGPEHRQVDEFACANSKCSAQQNIFSDPAPDAEHFQFAGTGEIYSFTMLGNPPSGFEEQAPYTLALIRLDEGPLLTAQLTDLDSPPRIGDRVEMVTRRLYSEGQSGMIVYGYKFRHILKRSKVAD